MISSSRRAFLGGMGSSMLAVSLGPRVGGRLGFLVADADEALDFGDLEPLVALMQETPPDPLQDILIGKLRAEKLELGTIVAAAALANARTFGGEDYDGYHCQMALMPAFAMAHDLPQVSAPLPVLKVVHRSTTRIQELGGRDDEVLRAAPLPAGAGREAGVRRLRAALEARDAEAAEAAFSELSTGPALDAFDDLQSILRETLDVHRVVLAWRAWEVMQLTGQRHAQSLLRQTVRFCVEAEERRVRRGQPEPRLRTYLPQLMAEHGLDTKAPGTRRATDEEVDRLCRVVFIADKAEAAAAVAQALGEGLAPADVGEAITLAATQLLLNDPGRSRAEPGKPKGSVHGASVGVHASDSARAWRNIAAVSNHHNALANLIAGAYHTAGQSGWVGAEPISYGKRAEQLTGKDMQELLACTRAAVEDRDQVGASAAVHAYGKLGCPERQMFDCLLEYSLEAEGALHAEKFYRTVSEDFRSTRASFRWRHLVALGRVCASQYGFEAPGLASAREALRA